MRASARWLLAAVVGGYVVFGWLYAVYTPKWQAPDEPAHYNYIQHLAEERSLPVLRPGDYPHEYLEEIKAAKFPPGMSISSIRMESHQPPLYYALTAVVYTATAPLGFDRQFLALRLFSVIIGAAVLLGAYHLVRAIYPTQVSVALVAAAGIAVIPMHIAMSSAINNDTLAELWLLLILVQCVRGVSAGFSSKRSLGVGVLLGLALLTKTTVYMAVAVAGIAWACSVARARRALGGEMRGGDWVRPSALQAIQLLLPAFMMTAPWFFRNLQVYGDLDLLGWKQHDSIVSGQLRTAQLVSQIGWPQFMQQFLVTTFRSFWGQFGWMGVLIDQRLYLALALLSAILVVGLAAFVVRAWRRRERARQGETQALVLLGASGLLTALTYLWYNTKFVQHQGRYLFPALGPLALGAALALRELSTSRPARWLAPAVSLALGALALAGLVLGRVHLWASLLLLIAAAFVAAMAWLPTRWRWLPLAALYLAFLALDWVCLFHYIVPSLT